MKWGDEGYAREELVELGSAFLSADLGIAPDLSGGSAVPVQLLRTQQALQIIRGALRVVAAVKMNRFSPFNTLSHNSM